VKISDICKKFQNSNKAILYKLKKKYVSEAMREKNTFIRDLLAFEAEFIHADSDTFFDRISTRSNVLSGSLKKTNEKRCRSFYSLFSMYYTITIAAKKRKNIDLPELKNALFSVFAFDETEKKLYELLLKCRFTDKEQFWPLFSRAFIGYMTGSKNPDLFAVAFTENFCYNSFKTFMRYFTQYTSVKRRIEKSKQDKAGEQYVKMDSGAACGY